MNEEYKKEYFNYFVKSNWKSILCMIIAMLILCHNDLFGGIVSLVFCHFYVHQFHYLSHLDFMKPVSILHVVHHETNAWWGHVLELLYEFIVLTILIFSKMVLDFFAIPFPFLNLSFLAFFYMFYTTHHNVNYSYFHVNRLHERHHKYVTTNLGLSVCDDLYGTKCILPNDKIEDIVENTDHYIPNIVLFLIVVLISNWYIEKYKVPNREYFMLLFVVLYMIFIILTLIYMGWKTMKSEKTQKEVFKKRIKDLLDSK